MENVKYQYGPCLAALLQARQLSVREHLLPGLARIAEFYATEADQSAIYRQLVNRVGGIAGQPAESAAAWCGAVDSIVRNANPQLAALVVDSDPVQRKFAATILTRAGWTVNTAATRDEGVWLGRMLPYKLILLDYELLDGTGAEAAKKLRLCSGPNCGTYIMGSSNGDHRRQCLEAGMDEYVQKPIDLTVLKYRALRVASRTPTVSSVP